MPNVKARRWGFPAAAALLCLACAGPAAAAVELRLSGGSAYNIPAPLSIRQDGGAVLDRWARYDTQGLTMPLYWAARAGLWRAGRAWEIELIHHKLYLTDKPPDVQEFNVSHGFNLVYVNRAWRAGSWSWRAGAGFVAAHPESRIRGRTFEGGGIEGYHLAGPAAQVSVDRRFHVWRGLSIAVEVKATLAWARVPVSGGHARLWNPALHGLLGVGWSF